MLWICVSVRSWRTLLPDDPGMVRDPVGVVLPDEERGAPMATGARTAVVSEIALRAERNLEREVVMDSQSAPYLLLNRFTGVSLVSKWLMVR